MNIREFERRLKKVNKNIRIEYRNSDPKSEVAGVYYKGQLICSVPRGTITKYPQKKYTTKKGVEHRSAYNALNLLRKSGAIKQKDIKKILHES